MKVIAFGTMKGGTGKTTLAFNLGALLARDHKVLLWDIDPQCNLSQSAGMDINSRGYCTTQQVFEEPRLAPEEIAVQLGCISENLAIIPGSIDLTITEAHLSSKHGRELILKYYIQDHKEFFEQYDYVILDTNPSMGQINQNGFVAADSIVLVSDVSMHSIRGVELFQYLWRDIYSAMRIPDTIKALILNNYDPRFKMSKDIVNYCQNPENAHIKDLFVSTVVPARVAFRRSMAESEPLALSDSDRDLVEILERVADELREKGVL